MKKILFFLVLIFSSLVLESQELLIICEPGYRTYIDGEFKGFTTDEQDGLYIPSISLGKHILEFKKGNDFSASYDLFVNDKEHNEITIKLFKETFRTDGYYYAYFYNDPGKKTLLGGYAAGYKSYMMLYFGDDDLETEEIEVRWVSISFYENQQRNNYTVADYYHGLFKGHAIGDLPKKRIHYIFNGTLNISDDEEITGTLTYSPPTFDSYGNFLYDYIYPFTCTGSFIEEGFNLFIATPYGYPGNDLDKNVEFTFHPMIN